MDLLNPEWYPSTTASTSSSMCPRWSRSCRGVRPARRGGPGSGLEGAPASPFVSSRGAGGWAGQKSRSPPGRPARPPVPLLARRRPRRPAHLLDLRLGILGAQHREHVLERVKPRVPAEERSSVCARAQQPTSPSGPPERGAPLLRAGWGAAPTARAAPPPARPPERGVHPGQLLVHLLPVHRRRGLGVAAAPVLQPAHAAGFEGVRSCRDSC